MLKLTLNEEKVRKELLKFPNGIKATQLMKQVFLKKTPLYTALNRLEKKKLAFRGAHNLWYPNPSEKEQSTKLDEFIEKRLEAIRQANLTNPKLAFCDLLLFMSALPSHIQEDLKAEIMVALVEISKSGTPQLFEKEAQRQERQNKLISLIVVYFVNKIPLLFNAQSGLEKKNLRSA
ncbi:MAG: hypothetical protein NWE94_04940 [Candidatus Bathyarchaeota archaeon]|nr:hypothetical protein [Candidatus Bathyarchaeota archaeon]